MKFRSGMDRTLANSLTRISFLFLVLSTLAIPAKSSALETKDCGNNVELRLSSLSASQGSLLSVVVSSEKPFDSLQVSWNGRELPFWLEHPSKKDSREQREALIGVDLEMPPGNYELSLTGQLPTSITVVCKVTIPVTEGHFATERLNVAKQFVEPNPEQVKRANAERDKLRAIFDHVSPGPLWTGAFRNPLENPPTGGNFGKRRVLNGVPGSPHGGVDFPAPTGTPIHAPQAGKVALAEELFFSGNTVVVDHGLGIYTFYGHLSEIDVKMGDEVQSGQILGKVGATGRVTGPHLHWGLTVNRARVNALDILKILGMD